MTIGSTKAIGMFARLLTSAEIGAVPLMAIDAMNSTAGGPKSAIRYHCGPTRTCRTWAARRRAEPGSPTIFVTTKGTAAKRTMLSSRNGSSGMLTGRIPKPDWPSSAGTKHAQPSP